jgi:hypothetical protein
MKPGHSKIKSGHLGAKPASTDQAIPSKLREGIFGPAARRT